MIEAAVPALDPIAAGATLADLGFLSSSDLPDRPGPAYLLVAIRPSPTLRHFDPETIAYWVSEGGRGRLRELTRETPMPWETDYSWGVITITDRLHVTNEYLSFGGRLAAAQVNETKVAVFTSPAPLLRRGGHSQGWDLGGENLAAFFGRILLAVDYIPGFEGRVTAADPLTRYAAFLADIGARYGASSALRMAHPDLWNVLGIEAHRLTGDHPDAWAAGVDLLDAARLAG